MDRVPIVCSLLPQVLVAPEAPQTVPQTSQNMSGTGHVILSAPEQGSGTPHLFPWLVGMDGSKISSFFFFFLRVRRRKTSSSSNLSLFRVAAGVNGFDCLPQNILQICVPVPGVKGPLQTKTFTLHSSQDVDVYIGQRRTALLRIATQKKVGRTLEQLLAHLEPQIKQALQVMSFSHTDITAALSDRVRLSPGNKESIADSMRAFKSSPG